VGGARWVQTELLDAYPDAKLRVYAVWFDMMPNDSRATWPATAMPDSRVVHLWDQPKAVGTWFAARAATIRPKLSADSKWADDEVLWDAALLYRPDARWTGRPTGLIRWTRTIVAGRKTLAADFARLFGHTAR